MTGNTSSRNTQHTSGKQTAVPVPFLPSCGRVPAEMQKHPNEFHF